MKLTDFVTSGQGDATCPGLGSATVTPSDTVNFTDADGDPAVARNLVVFGAGTVSFVGADGVADAWTFTSGMSFPQAIDVAAKRVNATGTTVTADIKAIW